MTMVCSGPQLLTATFQGATGPGNISVPGVKAGDVVLSVSVPPLGLYFGANFINTSVTADDEVPQTYGGDLSAYTFTVAFLRFL